MSVYDRDVSFDQLQKDPRVLKVIEYVKERIALDAKYGLKSASLHVNPGDIIMTRLGTVAGLKVEVETSTPRGRVDLR